MVAALAAALMLPALLMSPMAEVQHAFSGGAFSCLLGFPGQGGANGTSVELPADMEVGYVLLDIEGLPLDISNATRTIDFTKPAGSTAWSGTTQTVPPAQKPSAYEAVNSTQDPGLQINNDQQYLSTSAANSAAYQLFELYLGDAQLNNFTLYWKGMGSTTPKMGFSGVNIKLHLWNATAQSWWEYYSYQRPSIMEMDKEVTLDIGANASDYIDARGYVCMMATVSAATFQTSTMDTDYVSLTYTGSSRVWPENVKLDIGGDGSVEWNRSGRLQERATTSGAQLAAAFQKAVDAAAGQTVTVPLSLSSIRGGWLYLSNLSVGYGPRDHPPALNGTIPGLYMDEDSNVTLLDLRDNFTDDRGTVALNFSIVYQEDQSKLRARLDPDGHHVVFSTATQYWFGEKRFRVRAVDGRGQWAESNNFTVHVRFVDHPPVLDAVLALQAFQGIDFEHTFTASDPDMLFDRNESLSFSLNTSLLNITPVTGRAWFTPQNRDVGNHSFRVTARDHYGATATAEVVLEVHNLNDPPKLLYDVPGNKFSVPEDSHFTYKFNATDPDLDIGLDSLTFSISGDLSNISSDGLLDLAPDDRDIGVFKFRVIVTDSGGLKDSANFTLTVTGVPEPPVVEPVPDLTVDEDTTVRFHINATDQDAGDVARFSSDLALLAIDSNGWATFRADDKDVGVHPVTVTVRDSTNLSASVSFNITVRPVEEPPAGVVISSPSNGSRFESGKAIVLEGNASDEDGDALVFTWYSDGQALGTGPNLTVSTLKSGKHTLVLRVSDGSVTVSSPPVTIKVAAKPTASKGFIPGFGAALLVGALAAAGLLAAAGRYRKG